MSGSVWTQLLTALVVGLLVAFALQVLLTCLGVAIGMSVLAIRASSHPDIEAEPEREAIEVDSAAMEAGGEASSQSDHSASAGVQLGFWAGFGVLITVNTVLFAACFLAARFSQAQSPMTGAIEGLVIWSAYLLILIWLSSTAVSSVVGSLLSVTTGGFRSLIRPIGAMFTSEKRTSEESTAVTESEMRAAMRQEVQAAMAPQQLQSLIRAEIEQFPFWQTATQSVTDPIGQKAFKVQESNTQESDNPGRSNPDAILTDLQRQLVQFLQESDKLTPKRVDRHLQQMLEAVQTDLPDLALLPEIDRSMAWRLLMRREDLSHKQREKILHRLEDTWNEVRRSNQPASLKSASSDNNSDNNNSDSNSSASDSTQPSPAIQQLTETALKTIADQLPDSLTDRIDLDRVAQQLPELLQQAGNQLPQGASLAVLMMGLMRAKDLLPENGIDLQQLRQTLDRLMQESGMADLNQAVVEQVDQLRDRSMQQVDQVQQTVQDTVDQIKTQTREQLQATQRTATIAAWWLFLTVLTGGVSAAVAGAVANLVWMNGF